MGLCGNCTAWEDRADVKYKADPDIAGIGIIVVYIASAFITLCLSAANLVFTFSNVSETNPVDNFVRKAVKRVFSFNIAHDRRDFWIQIIQKLVLTISDQQLLTGIAVLIAAFWTHCSISVYHFALVNDLAFFSANVHLITLGVLPKYLQDPKRQVQRSWRVALMIVMGCLLVASTVMQGHYEWYDGWPYDAQCLFDDLIGNIGGAPRYWMGVNLALICIDYPLSIIPLFDRSNKFISKWLGEKPMEACDHAIDRLRAKKSHMTSAKFIDGSMRRSTCSLLIATVRAVGLTYFALIALITSQISGFILDLFWFSYNLWSLLEDRMIPSSEMDGDENAMTFGQIIPILLLSSLVLVLREAYDDQIREMQKPQHSSSSHSSQISLVGTRSSANPAVPAASQTVEMTGALQDSERDDSDHEPSPRRRIDTEMGGRSQTSGFKSGQLQRRTTNTVQTIQAPLTS